MSNLQIYPLASPAALRQQLPLDPPDDEPLRRYVSDDEPESDDLDEAAEFGGIDR